MLIREVTHVITDQTTEMHQLMSMNQVRAARKCLLIFVMIDVFNQ